MFSFIKKLDPNLKSYMQFNNSRSIRVLIQYKNIQDSITKKISSYKGTIISIIQSCNLICANISSNAIERLLEYPEIEYICLDQYFYLCGMSVETANKVKLSSKINISGKGVGVGIVDSGVYPHRDLTLPFNRIATFKDLINNYSNPYDDNGHGTCTCGIISGNGGSSNGMYRGVAPNATLHCIKAFDSLGKGFVSDVLYAVEYLINISQKYNIKVLCLPFELCVYNKFIFFNFDKLLKKAVSAKIVPIVPSGSNLNIDGSLTGIALSKNCITVSGLDTTSKVQSYTYASVGAIKKDSKPDFCAACVDIVSLNCNTSYLPVKDSIKIYAPKLSSSYKSFKGTSLAAAYISGLCALLFEENPTISFDDVVSLLKVGCEELELPKNQQGEGKININKIFNH